MTYVEREIWPGLPNGNQSRDEALRRIVETSYPRPAALLVAVKLFQREDVLFRT